VYDSKQPTTHTPKYLTVRHDRSRKSDRGLVSNRLLTLVLETSGASFHTIADEICLDELNDACGKQGATVPSVRMLTLF
jgi:hypothetical protein